MKEILEGRLEKFIELRKAGYGYKKLAKEFGITREQARYWCSKFNLLGINGYSSSNWTKVERINQLHCGFHALRLTNHDSKSYITLKCDKCGGEFERRAENIMNSIRNGSVMRCPNCKTIKKQKEKELKLEKEEERKRRYEETKQKVRDLYYGTEMTLDEIRRACSCSQDVVREVEEESEYRFIKVCKECGEEFKTKRKEQVYCSHKCNKKANRHGCWRRERRLKTEDVDSSPLGNITLMKLIFRDNNTCYLCGEKCDPFDTKRVNGRTQIGSLYPTIEHVIPVCKGGRHTWDNVKLAHMKCNAYKAMGEVDL